jgi:hypothetical protein
MAGSWRKNQEDRGVVLDVVRCERLMVVELLTIVQKELVLRNNVLFVSDLHLDLEDRVARLHVENVRGFSQGPNQDAHCYRLRVDSDSDAMK